MYTPDPTPQAVALWLKQVDRTGVHEEGWIAMNRRFNGITRAMRPFILKNYASEKEQEAAFDGVTLALLAVSHHQDLEQLAELFVQPSTKELNTPPKNTEILLPAPTETTGYKKTD